MVEPLNLGTTQSKGVELDFRQQLSFLPGVLKGLFLRANYTNVRTSAVDWTGSTVPAITVG